MNANTIITEDMTLEEKLAAIDALTAEARAVAKSSNPDAPFDPSSLTICDGCE